MGESVCWMRPVQIKRRKGHIKEIKFLHVYKWEENMDSIISGSEKKHLKLLVNF